MIDVTPVVVAPSPLADAWHTLLTALAMWLALKFHVATGGQVK